MKSFDFADIPAIGPLLKGLREDLDLSQVKVMELTGINNKTLSGYENGISEPDLRTLVTLARLYDFSLDSLLCADGKKSYACGKNETLLLKYYRKLSLPAQMTILMQTKLLSENQNSL